MLHRAKPTPAAVLQVLAQTAAVIQGKGVGWAVGLPYLGLRQVAMCLCVGCSQSTAGLQSTAHSLHTYCSWCGCLVRPQAKAAVNVATVRCCADPCWGRQFACSSSSNRRHGEPRKGNCCSPMLRDQIMGLRTGRGWRDPSRPTAGPACVGSVGGVGCVLLLSHANGTAIIPSRCRSKNEPV